jgi:hypothetical protein
LRIERRFFDAIQGEDAGRLAYARDPREHVHRVDHVAGDRDAIRLAEIDHLTRRVAGRVNDPESRHLVTLVEHPVDVARWSGEVAHDQAVDRLTLMLRRAHRPAALHRVDVVGVTGKWHVSRLADSWTAP